MTSATARALYKFADAVVFLEHSRSQRDSLDCAEACQESEADKVCQDALENLKAAKTRLFEALEKEDFHDRAQ